jgi:hypothetical protein
LALMVAQPQTRSAGGENQRHIPPAVLRHRHTGASWKIHVANALTGFCRGVPEKTTSGANIRGAVREFVREIAAEAGAAEREISQRPELLPLLGLPALRRVMAEQEPLTPAAGRVIRFDFHFTPEGWRISEANSDVPGGFSEASYFTGLLAANYPLLRLAGNPAETWCDALAACAGAGGQVALLSAPPLLEDHQVMAFLAIPLPGGQAMLDPLTNRPVAAVNVLPVISALRQGAEGLAGLQMPSAAPPAFLLDANRQGDGRNPAPGEFDNRSVCFTTDFPSANFLLAHGFRRALLVHKRRSEPQPDLSQVLRRWQEGGLALEIVDVDSLARPERFEIARPSWYGAMFQRALLAAGLRRATGGGFGAWKPESSAAG